MSICKICLCSDPKNDLTKLKSNVNVDQSGECILLFCLGIQVTHAMQSSTKLCDTCFTKLIEFHHFKTFALKNEAFLSSLGLQKFLENDIKNEVLSHVSHDNIGDDTLIDVPVLQEDPIGKECTFATQLDQEIQVEVKEELSDDEILSKKKSEVCSQSNKLGVFQCNICGKKLTSLYSLERHKVIHIPIEQRKLFECGHCGKMTRIKQSLQLHIIKEHPEEVSATVLANIKRYQCVMCSNSYYYPTHLVNHIKSSHNGEKIGSTKKKSINKHSRKKIAPTKTQQCNKIKGEKRHWNSVECAHCGKILKGKYNLQKHIVLIHPQEVSDDALTRTKKYQCTVCANRYQTLESLAGHIARNHHEEEQQCPICDKYFGGKNFKNHINMEHRPKNTQQENIKCGTCGRSFATAKMLRLHQSVHTGDRPFACDICGATFRLRYSVACHKAQVHDKVRDHVCHICSKRYFTASLLRRHIRRHPTEETDNVDGNGTDTLKLIKEVECPDCGKLLATDKSLKVHRALIHKVENGIKRVECPDCGKNLASEKTLRVHRALHKGERCICKVCGLSFTTRWYVRHHMKTHTQVRKFACKYCTATFVRSGGRRRHELEIHLGGKKPPRKDTRRNRKRKKKIKEGPKEEHVPNPPTVIVSVSGAPGRSTCDETMPILPFSGLFKTEEEEMCRYE